MGNRSSSRLLDEEIKLISEETGFTSAQIELLYSRFKSLDKSGILGSLSRQDFLAIPELAINPLCDRIVHMFFVDCDDDHDRINFRQFMRVLATFRSHKSSPLTRSRNVSRQESLNHQQQQSILKQAPLLFDSIDPSPFSSGLSRPSRHSSFHDGFHHVDSHQHHTTNQHSFRYAASSTHLPSPLNGHHHHHNNHHNHGSHQNHHHNQKLVKMPLVDEDEPANSMNNKLYFMFKIYDVNDDDLIDLQDLVSIIKMMVGTYVDDARVHRIAERSLREADKNCDGLIDFPEFCSIFECNHSKLPSFECKTLLR